MVFVHNCRKQHDDSSQQLVSGVMSLDKESNYNIYLANHMLRQLSIYKKLNKTFKTLQAQVLKAA